MLVGIGFDIHEHSENSELYLAGLKLEGEICGLQSSLQYKVI